LADDERVILYDREYAGGKYWALDDPEEVLRDRLSDGAYAEAMHALGIKVVVDI